MVASLARTSTWILALLCLASPALGALEISSSERSLLADASGFSDAEFDAQQDDVFFDLAGFFDDTASAQISIDDVAGMGFASQRTEVAPQIIEGRGSAGATGFSTQEPAFGGFAGESYLRVTFSVPAATPFALEAALSASAGGNGDSFASLDLSTPDTVLFSGDVLAGEDAELATVGVLLPGISYELLALARAFAAPAGLSTGDASSGFVFSFSVPEPTTAILFAVALAGLARTQRRARDECPCDEGDDVTDCPG